VNRGFPRGVLGVANRSNKGIDSAAEREPTKSQQGTTQRRHEGTPSANTGHYKGVNRVTKESLVTNLTRAIGATETLNEAPHKGDTERSSS